MRIVFFGSPEFAVLPLKTLIGSEHEILAVVTQPDRQSGRGRMLKPGPVKEESQRQGIKVLQPVKVREKAFIDELKRLNPFAIVVAAYGQILPPEIIHLPPLGCVNIHASLLPAYRGAAPINWAIINGEKKTGITTMLMDEGMDTGRILLQHETEIYADDTAGSLSLRLSKIGADMLIPTLGGLASGEIMPRLQKDAPSYAPLLKKGDGLIDWSKPAEELCNFIRGMNPWPGAYGFMGKERVKILRASPMEGDGEAGVVETSGKDSLIIGTGKGKLAVMEIQPAGKPVMTVKAYLQGRKIEKGVRFDRNVQRPA